MKHTASSYVKLSLASLLVLASCCLCAWRLMKIQVVESERYSIQHVTTQKYAQTIQATRGVIMNPKTGAVYAMATYPTFDLNNPSEIYDAKTAQELAALPESEYSTAYATARETQWKNKVISEISYPGSTFKIVTTADAFEENLINMETDSFYCSGQVQVADATIRCSNTAGHGAQTFTQALTNSCNPAFIEIGQRIGIDKFSYYFEGFGLAEKTGIDLPGEAVSYSVTGDDMTIVDLASAAYGQCNKVTAMELVTAYSAAINGGS